MTSPQIVDNVSKKMQTYKDRVGLVRLRKLSAPNSAVVGLLL